MGVKLAAPFADKNTTRSITGWSIGQGHKHAAAATTATISAHSDLGSQLLSREQKLSHAF